MVIENAHHANAPRMLHSQPAILLLPSNHFPIKAHVAAVIEKTSVVQLA